VGKSTLATLLAYQAEAGLVQTTVPLPVGEARRLMKGMADRDVLLVDELHLLVAGNRNRADWLLPFMTEGVLYTDRGAEPMPDVAIVGATTDVGKLQETLISRFMCQPTIVPCTEQEATRVVRNLSERMDDGVPGYAELAIARASDPNPRAVRRILAAVRDLKLAYPDDHPNLPRAREWAGVSGDGSTQT